MARVLVSCLFVKLWKAETAGNTQLTPLCLSGAHAVDSEAEGPV